MIDRKIVNYLAIWYLDRWIKGHFRLIDRKIADYLANWYQDRWIKGHYRLITWPFGIKTGGLRGTTGW